MANPGLVSVPQRFLPMLNWIPGYRREWLLPDALAGVALWAVMVPEAMAYAGIVGVPPIMGLYTIVPALLAYALLGTSRQLVVGPDNGTGLISAVTVGAIATQGTAEFNSLTSTLAVLIGLFFFSFGVMRMGWVASFIPTPVMRGFIEGLVYVTIIGQVPHLLGISGASGSFFTKLWHVLQHLSDVSLAPVLTGLLSLSAMLLLRYLAPAIPAALVVMATATIVIGLLGGEATGVHVAGHLPSGLPHLTLPNLDISTLSELVPGALAIVLVGYAEALGAAKAAALQSGGEIDPNQELIAHGPANILSGLFGGFLAVGSLSKTSVAISAGARTQHGRPRALLAGRRLLPLHPHVAERRRRRARPRAEAGDGRHGREERARRQEDQDAPRRDRLALQRRRVLPRHAQILGADVHDQRRGRADRAPGRLARVGRAPQPVLLDRPQERHRGLLGDAGLSLRRSHLVHGLRGLRDGGLPELAAEAGRL